MASSRTARDVVKLDGFYYDVNADYEFKLGPGRLKLIGLRHLDHEPLIETQIDSFSDGSPSTGTMFTRDSHIGETIGRAEYGWKTGKNDWQVTFERAYNSLDQKGGLFDARSQRRSSSRSTSPRAPATSPRSATKRMTTLSRPLLEHFDLQVAAGGEISRLDRVDDDQDARSFLRPKGSINLGWRPAKDWDASLKLRRRVGQISFYDFLAQPKLSDDRENAGNPDLVPPQSWEFETEIGHELGKWGKTRLNGHYYHRQRHRRHHPARQPRRRHRQPAASDHAGAWRAPARSTSIRSAGRVRSSTPISASRRRASKTR